MPTNRIPNPMSPHEVRQAFQRLNDSLSNIDISDDTNLAVVSPIVLTDDTLSLDQSAVDHGSIGGLSDDDHTQYHNDTRGDARYYTQTLLDAGQLDNRYFQESEFINSSAGAGDAGKPVILDAAGHIDATMINDGDIDHGSIGGLGDDDHTQYHNDGRAATWLAANHETTYNHPNYDTAYNWVNANDGVLLTNSGLTDGRIVLVGASGILEDSANLLHDGNGFFCTTFKVGQDANNVLELVGVLYGGVPVPAYGNDGGTGDRTGTITVTFSGTTSTDVTDLVDGTQDNEFWWLGQSASGKYLRFDFGVGEEKVITEATWYQSSSPTHGDWKWQGSANASAWTDIGSSFTLGGVEQVQTELSGNVDGYRYYQLLGVSGTTNFNPYLREIEFKIDDLNPVGTDYAPGLQAYKTDGATVQWLSLQPEGGNVSIENESPTARLHLPAGTTVAGTAPFKLTTGTNLTVAEAGALELTTDDLYFTITTGAVRKEIALTEGLTSGQVTFATTNGRLTDAAGLTWNGSLLTATGFSGGGVTTGADPGHTHTGASLSGIDISDDTNLTVTSPITLTDDDIGLDETAVDHDNLLNFVGNEHIDHTTVSVSSGSGLSGGGTIDSNQTLTLDINGLSVAVIAAGDFVPFWDITATATNKKITFANFEGTLDHDSLSGVTANEHIDWTSTNENLSTSGSITTPTLTDGRVVLAGSGGILEDSANLTFNGTTLSTARVALNTSGQSATFTNYYGADSDGYNIWIGGGGLLSIGAGGQTYKGARNVSLGVNALVSNTTGYGNIAIGYQVLDSNTSGINNVAIGASALGVNVDGAGNVAIGSSALLDNESGNNNFALGTTSLHHLVSGINNVAIGVNAGKNIAGSNNMAIGTQALQTTTGSNNVGVGQLALFSTTGSGSVGIGNFAGAYETGSNKLFIDNDVRASEADGRVKALVYGVFAATTAAQYLTINGHLIALEDLTTPIVLTSEIKTDTSTPTDLTITTGAAKTLILATSVFVDLQFPVATGKVTPASGEPSWETFTANTKEFAFDINDYIDLQANELFHHWKEGTNGHVHVHCTIKTAQSTGADRFVKFSVWVSYSDKNEVWVEQAVLSAEVTIPTGSSALKAFYLDMGDAVLTNYLRGGQVKIRVKRIAATGGTEYADDVFVTQVGMHLEIDKIGSIVEED